MKCCRMSLALAAMTAAVPAMVGSEAFAVDRNWNTGSANWGLSSSWTPAAVPTSSDIVYLNYLVSGNRGRAFVNGTSFASPISISIRQLNELNINSFSALTVGGDILVGYGSSVGYVNLNGPSPGVVVYNGNLTVGNTLRLGYESSLGIVNQNDGTVTVNQLVRVGDRHATSPLFPATGRYNLSGVGVLNAARLEIGYGGDSGQWAADGEFNLSGSARLNISLGAQIPDPRIGGGGRSGVLNQTGGTLNSPNRIIDFAPGGGSGIWNFSGGTATIVGVHFNNTGGVINYTGGANLSVGQLQMTGGGNVLLSAGGNKTLRTTLLWVANNSAVLDLNDNDMVANAVLETIGGQPLRTLLSRGYASGAWTGTGVTSTAARNNSQGTTGLGYALVSEVLTPVGGVYTYNGQTVTGTSTIVKYTWYGDADLNGLVDFDDYVRIDAGFNGNRTGWVNGDFNYDNAVDFDDYVLIDLGYNGQSGTLRRAIEFVSGDDRSRVDMTSPALHKVVEHFDRFGTGYASHFLSAVPEPGTAVPAAATILAAGRRLRRRPSRTK